MCQLHIVCSQHFQGSATNHVPHSCCPTAALQHTDNGVLLDASLLQLIAQYAAHPSAAKQLLQAGAESVLHHRSDGCNSVELLRLLHEATTALTGFGDRAGRMMSSGMMSSDPDRPAPARPPPANIATTLAAMNLSHTPMESHMTHTPLASHMTHTPPRSHMTHTPLGSHTLPVSPQPAMQAYPAVHASSGQVVQNTPWPGPYHPSQGAATHHEMRYSPLPAVAATAMLSPPVPVVMSHQRMQSPTPRMSAWSPAGTAGYRHTHSSPSPSPHKGARVLSGAQQTVFPKQASLRDFHIMLLSQRSSCLQR